MGPLDILNTAGSSLPTLTNCRAVQDPQRRNSFTAGASVYGPLLEIQALFLIATPNNSLAKLVIPRSTEDSFLSKSKVI